MTDEQTPEKKSKKTVWIILGVVVGIIVLGMVAIIALIGIGVSNIDTPSKKIGESTTSNTVNESVSSDSEKDTNNDIQEPASEYKVNDIIKIRERTLTINEVQRNWHSSNSFDTPESGKEYVLVNVTITNEGSDSISYNAFDFKVQDSNGVQKDEAFAIVDDSLDSGDLAKNGKITGNMVFEVSQNDNDLKLLFNPTFWSDEVIVNLQ